VTPERARQLTQDLRRHRRGAPLTAELAKYLSVSLKCWRADPTAREITFDEWCASTEHLRPTMKPLVVAVQGALVEQMQQAAMHMDRLGAST
jgi:hypothetical protein